MAACLSSLVNQVYKPSRSLTSVLFIPAPNHLFSPKAEKAIPWRLSPLLSKWPPEGYMLCFSKSKWGPIMVRLCLKGEAHSSYEHDSASLDRIPVLRQSISGGRVMKNIRKRGVWFGCFGQSPRQGNKGRTRFRHGCVWSCCPQNRIRFTPMGFSKTSGQTWYDLCSRMSSCDTQVWRLRLLYSCFFLVRERAVPTCIYKSHQPSLSSLLYIHI